MIESKYPVNTNRKNKCACLRKCRLCLPSYCYPAQHKDLHLEPPTCYVYRIPTSLDTAQHCLAISNVFFGFFWVSHNTWQMHVNKQVIKYPFATPLHAMGAWLALLAATCVNADTLHSCIYTGTATCQGEPFCTQEVMAPENCAFQLTIQGSGCKALPTMFGMSSSTSVYCAADDEHLKLLEIKDTWRRQCTYSNNDCTAWVGKEPNCVEYNYANTAGSGSDVCTSLCATVDCGACVPYLQSTGELGSAAQTAFAEMVVGSAWYDPAIYATFRTTCGLPSGAPTIDTDIMGSHFYDLSGNLPVLTLPTTTMRYCGFI